MSVDDLPNDRSKLCANLIGTGGALLAVSVFLPWVNVVLFGNLTLMQLAKLDGRQSSVVVGVVVGVLLALAGFSLKKKTPVLLVGAFITAAIAGLNVVEFAHEVSKAGGLVGLGDGSYLAMLAVVVLFIGAVLPTRAQQTVASSSTLAPNGKFCGSCGKPMATNSVFCPQCGAAVEETNQTDVAEMPQDKERPSETELAVALEKLDRDELTDEEWSDLGIEDDDSSRRRRSVWNHPLVVGLIAILLIPAGAGAVAMAIKGHHDATPTNSSTTQTTTNPSGLVAVSLPLFSCDTTYGIAGTKAARLPNYVREMIPRGNSGKLAVFADAQGIMELVGPSQWGCDASIGADGTSTLFISPIGSTNHNGALASSSTSEQISGSQTSACVSCGLGQACPLFAVAAQQYQTDYQQGCPSSAPASESITQLTANVVEFTDPPGVHGDGNPSGGAYAARGAMTFSSGQIVTSWMETCVLPANQQSLCSASVHDFVSVYGSK
jgi:hypothetical protein